MPLPRNNRSLLLAGGLGAVALALTACASDPPAEEPVASAEAPAAVEPAAPPAAGRDAPAGGAVAGGAAPSVTAERSPDGGLGLSREEVIQVFADSGLDPAAFEMQDLGDGRQVMTASYPESAQRQVLFVALFGQEQDPHTIRVDYFPINAQGEEAPRVGQTLDSLMRALFPSWEQAPQWPEAAGQRAWQETARMAQEAEGEGQQEMQIPIFESDREGVSLTAVSIPPSVVSYVLTTKDTCRPANPAAQYNAGYVGCV